MSHSVGRRKFSENPAEVGLLPTEPVCSHCDALVRLLWEKDVAALSGRTGLSSEPREGRGMGQPVNVRDLHANKNASRWEASAREPTNIHEVKSGMAGEVFLGHIWEKFIMLLYENNLLGIHLPIEVVDTPYVSKKGWPVFRPQRKFRLVADAVKVILWNQWEVCLKHCCPSPSHV